MLLRHYGGSIERIATAILDRKVDVSFKFNGEPLSAVTLLLPNHCQNPVSWPEIVDSTENLISNRIPETFSEWRIISDKKHQFIAENALHGMVGMADAAILLLSK